MIFDLFEASGCFESSHKSDFFHPKKKIPACATCSELPSNKSTLNPIFRYFATENVRPCPDLKLRRGHRQVRLCVIMINHG